MEHWSKRLTAAREAKGWTVAELARRTDISKDRIHKFEDGKVESPRGDALPKLAKKLGVSVVWLVHGVQESGVPTTTAGLPSGQISSARKVPVIDLSMLSLKRPTDDLPALLKEREVMNVPDEVGERDVILRVDTERMAPRIPENSLVLCNRDAQIEPGDTVFAMSFKTKRAEIGRFRALAPDNSQFELRPENDDFSPVKFLTKADGFIIGRAMALWTRL